MKISPKLIRILFGETNQEIITMQDIIDEKISRIEVYKRQMDEWYFNPIKSIIKNYESNSSGISIFLLEIVFFESHGQFLLGESSQNKSNKTFKKSFECLIKYLVDRKKLDSTKILSDNVYDKIRNGLFHNAYIKDGFLIDSLKSQDKSFYKNCSYDGWLVNPWILHDDIKDYFSNYIKIIENDNSSDGIKLKENFNKMFDDFYYSMTKNSNL
jgi:hypothetical protein